MNRYPALGFYQGAMSLLGWGIIVLGIIAAIGLSSSNQFSGYGRFSWEVFIPIFLTSLVTGGGFLITSELIGVLVNIESRLIEMRDMNRRREAGDRAAAGIYTGESSATMQRSVDVAENETITDESAFQRRAAEVLAGKAPISIEELAQQRPGSVWGVVTADYLLLRTAPNVNAPRAKKVILGEEIKIMGLGQNFNWVLIHDSDKKLYWARTSGIAVDDDIAHLPVIKA